MNSTLPPSAADSSKKQREVGRISDAYKPDMNAPYIKSRFPLVDRIVNLINCCKPVKDPVGTMLD